MWLRGKGTLKKEDQQYGEWMRAKQFRQIRKSIAIMSGSARNQTPWGRNFKSPTSSNKGHSKDNFSAPSKHGSKGDSVSSMNVDQRKTNRGRFELARGGNPKVRGQNDSDGDEC